MPRVSNKQYDVVVVGAGISGFVAASSLQKSGKHVAVLCRAPGATSLSSGAWDFGPVDSPSSLAHTVSQQWMKTYSHCFPTLHFSNLSETIRQTASFCEEHLKPLSLRFSFDSAWCLPTSSGTWKSTFGAQSFHTGANLANLSGKKVALLGSPSWRFSADSITLLLKSSAKKLGHEIHVMECPLALPSAGNDISLSHLATRIRASEEFRTQFVQATLQALSKANVDFLLLPPLFIETRHFDDFQSLVKTPVAETLATLEPTAGFRLHQAMVKSFSNLEIDLLFSEQLSFSSEDSKIRSLKFKNVKAEWEEISAKQYVLASGKILSGGIRFGYEHLSESVFSLPLFANGSAESVFRRPQLNWDPRRFEETQSWATLGIRINPQYQPIDGAGNIIYKNLYACGSVLGGVDFAKRGLGLGFMALTGKGCADVMAKV